MNLFLFLVLSAVAFGIGAVAHHLGRFGTLLQWAYAGVCLFVFARVFNVTV